MQRKILRLGQAARLGGRSCAALARLPSALIASADIADAAAVSKAFRMHPALAGGQCCGLHGR